MTTGPVNDTSDDTSARIPDVGDDDLDDGSTRCWRCHGTGLVAVGRDRLAQSCPRCDGTGTEADGGRR